MTEPPRLGVFGAEVGAEELAAVAEVLESGWMGAGPRVQEFERRFAERVGASDSVLVDSGSNALYIALRLLDLPPGTEVVVPAWTWVACANVVLYAGCRPVFCDVDYDSQNLTAATVAPCLSPNTAAIMAVHYAGKPARVDALGELGLPVIEDAAHAVDSRIGARACGMLGDVGVYSFDPVKNLAMPNGGGIVARDPEALGRARALRRCGFAGTGHTRTIDSSRWWEQTLEACSLSFLPNDVNAAIGLVQLRRLDERQRARRLIWDHYQSELGALSWLRTPPPAGDDEQHSLFTFIVRVARGRRDALARYLLDRGIYTTVRFEPLHRHALFESRASLPVCDRLREEALNLPLHPGLSREDIDRIVDTIRAFDRSARSRSVRHASSVPGA